MAEQYSVEIIETEDGPIAIKIVDVCAVLLRPGEEARQHANFAFIADAFNVAAETGLTPRELAEHRAKLLAMVKKLHRWHSLPAVEDGRFFLDEMESIIADAEVTTS